MRSLLVLSGLVSLALLGCGERHYLMHYSVDIDPNFSTEQTESVLAGVDSWELAIPRLILDVQVSSCQAEHLCLVVEHTTDSVLGDPVGHTEWQDNDQEAQSYLMVDRIAQVGQYGFDPSVILRQTAAHELGHAMMGSDHLAPGSLMAAGVQEQAHGPTRTDIQHFWGVR